MRPLQVKIDANNDAGVRYFKLLTKFNRIMGTNSMRRYQCTLMSKK
jgi:hypothetical protein